MKPDADTKVYANCMQKVQMRVAAAKTAIAEIRTVGREDFVRVEVVFLQFRKICELIAYASLSANKAKYAEAHKNYSEHWKAKDMLKAVERVNPEFYPQALLAPLLMDGRHWRFPGRQENALTREEFERLYDASSEVLHMRNPFSTKDPTIHVGYSADVWISRIENLLRWHRANVVDGGIWIVNVPAEGEVNVSAARPSN
jgi:hypothetical protein